MENTLINIIGNICTGKTTLVKELNKSLKWKYLSIDEYRIKHRAFNYFNDFNAWVDLRNDLKLQKKAILETSGTSIWMDDLYKNFNGKRITVKLVCNSSEILNRLENRNKNEKEIPLFCRNSDDCKLENIQKRNKVIDIIPADVTFDTSHISTDKINEITKKIFNILMT